MNRVIFYLAGIMFCLLGILLGGELRLFLDMPSLTIVGGSIVVFSIAHHGPASIIEAVRAAASTEAGAHLPQHYQVLQNVRRIAMTSGIIGGLIGMTALLFKLYDPKSMGPAMAVAILSMLYGLIVSELFIGPLCSRIRARGSAQADWNTPNENRLYIYLILIFMQLAIFFLLAFGFFWSGIWHG